MAKDYYETLGVGRNASADEIKAHTESLQKNITLTLTRNRERSRNLKT